MNTSFRLNGFTIAVFPDKVVASQHGINFVFSTLEDAIDVLTSK